MKLKLYVFFYQVVRLLIALIPGATLRSRVLRAIRFFNQMGENVHFQPRKLPADPKYIRLHNNISVASGVVFVTHDIMHYVFNGMDGGHEFNAHVGCIEIMNDVFIGANAMIMPDVRIGPRAIVAAGAVVTKDVAEGEVVGGVPARNIGDFREVLENRRRASIEVKELDRRSRAKGEWSAFDSKRRALADRSVD